ncbi:hypothetical protein Taro_004446 [Colocasia esculenta]|uniref:Uncharacterized protein n=1 Tax=Colocasia esculenta TaxID=4460 RepID=A0A843TMD3_COLES|nr:hypothetical protein [Colocasia esculenta]
MPETLGYRLRQVNERERDKGRRAGGAVNTSSLFAEQRARAIAWRGLEQRAPLPLLGVGGAASWSSSSIAWKCYRDLRRINPKVPREEVFSIFGELYRIIKEHGPLGGSPPTHGTTSRRPFGENTDDLVGEIARLDKFELKVGDEVCNDIHIRKIIYEIAGRRYRDVRSTLYRHYQSYATDEDHLQNPPEDINANEWAWLVNYFGSQKFKAMSERNKANRSKQVISHITGRRSFKQVSWAERNEGGEPPAHELWRLTHQKKDGSWGSEQSRQVYETVKDKSEELASQPCDSPIASTPEEVLSLVVRQRSGYVRGRGCGPRPPSKSAVTTATIAGLQAQVKDKDERISQMEELISKQREEVAQIQEMLFKQKEEVTAEVTVEVTARLQSDMSSQLNELVNKKFMDMMFQFHRDLGPGH